MMRDARSTSFKNQTKGRKKSKGASVPPRASEVPKGLSPLPSRYEIRRTEYTSPNDVMELTNEEIRKWFLFFFKKYSG